MKKLGVFVMSVVFTGMLSGCFDSTPSCDDKEVKDLLTDILKEQVLSHWGMSQKEINDAKITYGTFMTEATDKEKKKVTCKAQMTMRGDNDWIHYTARMTDDNSHIYVEILDIQD